MLTKEQWNSLAMFAGVEVEDVGSMPDDNPALYMRRHGKYWQPLTDWRDFGPLWVKLYQWMQNEIGVVQNSVFIFNHAMAFESAILEGTEAELMQAGCQLGAAIGALAQEDV